MCDYSDFDRNIYPKEIFPRERKLFWKLKNGFFFWIDSMGVIIKSSFQQSSLEEPVPGIPYREAWGSLFILGGFILLFIVAIVLFIFSPILALSKMIVRWKDISTTRDVHKERKAGLKEDRSVDDWLKTIKRYEGGEKDDAE